MANPTDTEKLKVDEEYIIRVRGLPWSAKVEDVKSFFYGCRIKNGNEGVHFTYGKDGRASGEAYIEFSALEDFNSALERNHCHMGKRYVEVFKSKRSEMDYVIKRTKQRSGKDSECVVRLRGLPYGCSKEEIAQFFTGYEIIPNGITFATDRDGRSTGEAFVEFASTDIAERALSKDKEMIGHRYIEIFRAKKSDIRSMNIPKIRPLLASATGSRPTPYDRKRGGRFGYGHSEGSFRGRSLGRGYQNVNRHVDYPGFDRPPEQLPYERREPFEDRSSYDPHTRDRFPREGDWNVMEPERFRDFDAKAHSIRMRGLPFKVTENEIVEFFEPLPVANITIEYNNDGKASGESVVDFFNHEDAVEAMSKDRHRIKHRYIELFLNSSPVAESNAFPEDNQGDYQSYDYGPERGFDANVRRDHSVAEWAEAAQPTTSTPAVPYVERRDYTVPKYDSTPDTYDMWYGDRNDSKSSQVHGEQFRGGTVRIGDKKQYPYNENPFPTEQGGTNVSYKEPASGVTVAPTYNAYSEERIDNRVNISTIPKPVNRPTQENFQPPDYSSVRPTITSQQQGVNVNLRDASGVGGSRIPVGGYQYSHDRNPRANEITAAAVGYGQVPTRSVPSSSIATRTVPVPTNQNTSNLPLQRDTGTPTRYTSSGTGYGNYVKMAGPITTPGGDTRFPSSVGQPRVNTSFNTNYSQF